MHFTIRQAVDRLDSEALDDLHPAQIDHYINLAQDLEVELRLGRYNQTMRGFESDQKRIDDLSVLLVKSPTDLQSGITPLVGTDIWGTFYYFDLADLDQEYLQLTNLRAIIEKTNCTPKTISLKPVQDDDLNSVMTNTNYQPDFNWGIGYYSINQRTSSNTSVFMYTGGEYSVTTVYPHYIRKPKRVYIGGYTSLDGTATVTDCELTRIHQQICDRAVNMIKTHIGDYEGANASERLKLFNEQ